MTLATHFIIYFVVMVLIAAAAYVPSRKDWNKYDNDTGSLCFMLIVATIIYGAIFWVKY